MFRGHVIVGVVGSGTEADPQRPDITLTGEGHSWEDITGIAGHLYINPPPNSLVVYVEADEATFLALGDAVLWYEEVLDETV